MSGAVCHAGRGAGQLTAKWMDADSRMKEIGDLGNKAESETRLRAVCNVRALGESLLRATINYSGMSGVLSRQVINPAAAHHYTRPTGDSSRD